jgi:hypothetical protein
MRGETLTGATHPVDVADWEDLLVRIEIMPRALKGALEDAAGQGRSLPILRDLLAREVEAGEWLERVATGEAGDASRRAAAAGAGDATWLADRFAAVRSRNFAMLQRRGVDVWEWAGELDGRAVTVYQLLSSLLRADAEALAALRGVGAC